MNKKSTKRKIWASIAFIIIFIGLMFFLFSGGNLQIVKEMFKDEITKEELWKTVSELGPRAYITIGSLSMLQVVFTFVPAEPIQVMAGISFGLLRGSIICLVGVFIGNSIIYMLYRLYGQKLTEYFQNNAEFDFDVARRSHKITLIIFILYFLPAIPYGLICFFTASLDMKYPKYILLTTFGSIPSILIGVGLGHLAIAANWIISVIVFAVLVVLLILLFKNKAKVFAKINEFIKKREKKLPRANGAFLALLAFGTKFIFDTKVKIKMQNNVGRLQRPSIVLCNHGSFIDFVYAGRMLRKEKPHFIAARLYFYHKLLGKLMRSVGCLPKSMFSTDLENAKNCMHVLSNNEVLAMMPEARLSTVGLFEGIQDSTYKFLQHANVPIYSLHLSGDYLADPKWGDGARKGGLVEIELNLLLDAKNAKTLSPEEFKKHINAALDYNEFEWLETKPELAYKTKTLAEGLENILYKCPKCGGICTISTNQRTLHCDACGMQTSLNDRYRFTETVPFENFAQWYAWQTEETKKEILEDPDYRLQSKVELRHSSVDGKSCTRHAGEGVCVLDKSGLLYKGTEDGKEIEKFFPLSQIYRLLFGAGEDFEIYEGKEIWYFIPEERRSCVIWYVASGLLKEIYEN